MAEDFEYAKTNPGAWDDTTSTLSPAIPSTSTFYLPLGSTPLASEQVRLWSISLQRLKPTWASEIPRMSIMAAGDECTATFAAAFQSWAYGGFTPAGGIFATLTSMGMLGYLVPIQVAFSAVLATLVTVVVWACGVGT